MVTCIAGNSSTIGNAAIADREVAFNQQINSITPHEFIDTFFLYAQILALREKIKGSSSGGMKGIVSKGIFEKITSYRPSFRYPKKILEFGRNFAEFARISKPVFSKN
ncbi:MAG: hypothetical protein UZ14_CFX002001005 [Chloroflexi bacterium OLB14]|nr:MAG: hypothetical protein UZ14_CFX002001005 [Chloroflexi bacterium OLB14]